MYKKYFKLYKRTNNISIVKSVIYTVLTLFLAMSLVESVNKGESSRNWLILVIIIAICDIIYMLIISSSMSNMKEYREEVKNILQNGELTYGKIKGIEKIHVRSTKAKNGNKIKIYEYCYKIELADTSEIIYSDILTKKALKSFKRDKKFNASCAVAIYRLQGTNKTFVAADGFNKSADDYINSNKERSRIDQLCDLDSFSNTQDYQLENVADANEVYYEYELEKWQANGKLKEKLDDFELTRVLYRFNEYYFYFLMLVTLLVLDYILHS